MGLACAVWLLEAGRSLEGSSASCDSGRWRATPPEEEEGRVASFGGGGGGQGWAGLGWPLAAWDSQVFRSFLACLLAFSLGNIPSLKEGMSFVKSCKLYICWLGGEVN